MPVNAFRQLGRCSYTGGVVGSAARSTARATRNSRLLWLVVIGLAALGLWLLLSAFLNPGLRGRKRLVRSLSQLGKAVVCFVIAFTALVFARGETMDSVAGTRDLSAQLLATPGGVLVVILIGVAIVGVGVGVYCLVKGVSRRFERDLRLPGGTPGRATVVLGILGYVAKGIAMGAVGIPFVIAALTVNPAGANGLDGALRASVNSDRSMSVDGDH